MLREGPIPQAVQGLFEYLGGVLFIAAPFLFGFTDVGAATAASIVFGIGFLVLAATSQGPTGLVKQLSPPVHALLDAVLAILLIAAPFVLGFSDVPTPRNLFLVTGVVWLLVTIGSRYGRRQARTEPEPVGRAVPPVPAGSGIDPHRPSIGASSDAPPAVDPAPAADGEPAPGDAPGADPARGSVGPGYGPLDGGRTGPA
ncbi:MAG: hypothetical protein JWP46_1200 [Modestobacter sp.]|nr:hypothetical protein [Modestobacter sp.]